MHISVLSGGKKRIKKENNGQYQVLLAKMEKLVLKAQVKHAPSSSLPKTLFGTFRLLLPN